MTKKEAVRQTHQENVLMELGFTRDEAEALRRISLTLRRWHEHECNGAIQRDGDDGTGRPFWYNTDTGRKLGPVADREAGAMRSLKAIIIRRNARITDPDSKDAELNIHAASYAKLAGPVSYYVQGDPRGAALYIIRPGDMPEGADVNSYYVRGIVVY